MSKRIEKLKVYMCGIDWSVESFHAPDSPEFFRTIAELKRKRVCWRECGIVELEIRYLKTVKKGTL